MMVELPYLYTLGNEVTMNNCHSYTCIYDCEKSLFSIAMLNYQRDPEGISSFDHGKWVSGFVIMKE